MGDCAHAAVAISAPAAVVIISFFNMVASVNRLGKDARPPMRSAAVLPIINVRRLGPFLGNRAAKEPHCRWNSCSGA